jgi:pimeloyl-ACP methyl ester carboxylesterase
VRVREPLATVRRLLLVDGPGHGRNPPVARRFTLDECAGAATDLLDHFRIAEPVDWVGNAMGGHVGIPFAAAYPGRCRSLATIGCPVHALTPPEWRKIALLTGVYRLTGPLPPLVNLLFQESQQRPQRGHRQLCRARLLARAGGQHERRYLTRGQPPQAKPAALLPPGQERPHHIRVATGHLRHTPRWKIFGTDDLKTPPGPKLTEIIGACIGGLAARYQAIYPAAAKMLLTDREGLTAYLRFPAEHHHRIRHANSSEEP